MIIAATRIGMSMTGIVSYAEDPAIESYSDALTRTTRILPSTRCPSGALQPLLALFSAAIPYTVPTESPLLHRYHLHQRLPRCLPDASNQPSHFFLLSRLG